MHTSPSGTSRLRSSTATSPLAYCLRTDSSRITGGDGTIGPLHAAVLANGANSWVWWSWIPDHQHEIYAYLREHMALTALSVGFGILIALPLAVLAARRRAVAAVVVPVVNAIYTIPSVALLGLLLPTTGTGRKPAVIALTLYSLAILVRNVLEGLRGVPADVLDAADGMGYTRPGACCAWSCRWRCPRSSPGSGSPPSRRSASSR